MLGLLSRAAYLGKAPTRELMKASPSVGSGGYPAMAGNPPDRSKARPLGITGT
jgi:hypothetical protein